MFWERSSERGAGGSILLVTGSSAVLMFFTSGEAAKPSSAVTGSLARTALYSGSDEITVPPSERICSSNALAPVVVPISTRT